MGSEIDGGLLDDKFKGYIFRITGGNDKQGFTMKQGIMVNGRVRVLMRGSKYLSPRGVLFSRAFEAFKYLIIIDKASILNITNINIAIIK